MPMRYQLSYPGSDSIHMVTVTSKVDLFEPRTLTNPEKTDRVGLMLKNVISDQTTRKDIAAEKHAARRRQSGATRHLQYHSNVGV